MASVSKELKEITRAAEDQGWRVERTSKGHLMFYAPDRENIVTTGHTQRPPSSGKLGLPPAPPRVRLEREVAVEHRFTITLAELGHSEEAVEQVLEAFLEHHPEVGPVVSANLASGELSITWAIEAEDARDAYERSTPVFLESMTASGVPEVPPVRVEIEAVEAEEAVEDDASPALQPA